MYQFDIETPLRVCTGVIPAHCYFWGMVRVFVCIQLTKQASGSVPLDVLGKNVQTGRECRRFIRGMSPAAILTAVNKVFTAVNTYNTLYKITPVWPLKNTNSALSASELHQRQHQ